MSSIAGSRRPRGPHREHVVEVDVETPFASLVRSTAASRRASGHAGMVRSSTLGDVSGGQAIEYVIRRAGTQVGVPHSWGGGSLTGPRTGVDSDSGTTRMATFMMMGGYT